MWLQWHIQRVAPEVQTFCGTEDPRPRNSESGSEMWDPGPASVVGWGTIKMETKTRDSEPRSEMCNSGSLPKVSKVGLETNINHLNQAKAILFFH